MELLTEHGQVVKLLRRFGREGGEGAVYEIAGTSSQLAKVYKIPPDAQKTAKLRYQIQNPTPSLRSITSWPTSLLVEPGGRRAVRGIVIPRMAGKEIHMLYTPHTRAADFPKAGWDFLIHVAMNSATAFEVLHQHGVVMADVNEGNLLVKESDGCVGLIDCDSYQLRNGSETYLCGVGVPMWTPPELQGQNFHGLARTQNHDRFGLAVIIFRLLFMGRHPHAGIPVGREQDEVHDAIKKCLFAFSKQTWSRGVKPPPYSLPLESVPESLQSLFERAFNSASVYPNARPSGSEWAQELRALLGNLSSGCRDPGHKYWKGLGSCPWCEICGTGGPNFFISVAIHVGTSDLTADCASYWAAIERIVQGALMRERAAAPSVGKMTPRPMPCPKPSTFNRPAPAMPVKPPQLAKVVQPAPQLPPKPTIRPPSNQPPIPKGPNELQALLCGTAALFFAVIAFVGWIVDVVATMYGAIWAFLASAGICAVKWRLGMDERSQRLALKSAAQQRDREHAQRDYEKALKEYELKVQSMLDEHNKALARTDADYKNQWLSQDREYQRRLNAYLSELLDYNENKRRHEEESQQWNTERNHRNEHEANLRKALNESLIRLHELLNTYQVNVNSKHSVLQASRQRFEAVRTDELADLRKLHQQKRELLLRHYLSNQLLQSADIPTIGSTRKATLSAFGIGSALDIRRDMNVPGFGEVLVGYLLVWRQQCESRFQYNPNTQLPTAEVNVVKVRHAQRRQTTIAELRSGASALEALEIKVRAETAQMKAEIQKLSKEYAQAAADLTVCM